MFGAALAWLPVSTTAQTHAQVRRQENLRQTPNGAVLGRLDAGTPLTVVSRQQSWLQVDLEGWIWTRSVQRAARDGFDLIVSARSGENLRAAPSGAQLGHLDRGTLLHELERRPGWLHVGRRAWIWAASVTQSKGSEPATSTHPSATADGPAGPGRAADTTLASARAARRPQGFMRVGARGAPILNSAGGDTIALSRPGTELEVLSRDGSWVHVRLDGWTWLPAGDTLGSGPSMPDSALTPAELARKPKAYRGRVVAWTLQFIALEHAEKVRTDFFEGEPYLLTRFGGSQGPFVYVAVSPGRLPEVEGLAPLDRIAITGRIRTGASALTGTPIVDLLTLKRLRSKD